MTSNRLATYVLWSKGSNQQFTSVHFVVLLASFRPVENSGEEGSAGGRAIMGYKDRFFLHNKQGISFFSTQKKRLGVGKDASRRLARKTEAFQEKGLSVSRERPRRFRAKPRSWEANQCRQADTGLQNSPSKPRPKGSLFRQRPFGRIARIIKRNHAIQEARGEAES